LSFRNRSKGRRIKGRLWIKFHEDKKSGLKFVSIGIRKINIMYVIIYKTSQKILK